MESRAMERELGHGERERERKKMMEEAKWLKEGSVWWSSLGRKRHRQSEDTAEIERLLDDVTYAMVGKEQELFQASRDLL